MAEREQSSGFTWCHSRRENGDQPGVYICAHPKVRVAAGRVTPDVCRNCIYAALPAPEERRVRIAPNPPGGSHRASRTRPARSKQSPKPQTNVLKKGKRQRPWQEFNVSIAIPYLDTPEILELSVRAWQLQNHLPYIIVVDTGSESQHSHDLLGKLQQIRGVEAARLNIWTAVEHTSDRVAIAMDYCFSRCPTEYLLSTHADVFPVHRDVVEKLRLLCGPDYPVVGWEMSARGKGDGSGRGYLSDGFPGHACTMFHMPTMDRIGAGWSIRRAHHLFGLPRGHAAVEGWRWPDTEVCLGRLLQASGIKPLFLGRETNNDNQLTEDWLHSRSMTVHSLINGELLPRHEQALQLARKWISEWEREDVKDMKSPAPYVSVLGLLTQDSVAGGSDCRNANNFDP